MRRAMAAGGGDRSQRSAAAPQAPALRTHAALRQDSLDRPQRRVALFVHRASARASSRARASRSSPSRSRAAPTRWSPRSTGQIDVTQSSTPYLISARHGGIGCGGDCRRSRQSGLHPDRAAGDRELRRPQGQDDRAVDWRRHDLDHDAQALAPSRPARERLSGQGARRHARALRMPQARRMRRGAARAAGRYHRRRKKASAGSAIRPRPSARSSSR